MMRIYSVLKANIMFASLCMFYSGICSASTLYDDLGGKQNITVIVDKFLWNLADDNRINDHFIETNLSRFREKLIELFCELAKGPCVYSGDNMERTHRGMNLNDADFNAVVEDLIYAMEDQAVPTGVQNRLLKLLAALYTDIVRKSSLPLDDNN